MGCILSPEASGFLKEHSNRDFRSTAVAERLERALGLRGICGSTPRMCAAALISACRACRD